MITIDIVVPDDISEVQNQSIKSKISKIIEKVLKEHIQNDIYGVYTPKVNGWKVRGKNGKLRTGTYQRRGVLLDGITTVYNSDDTFTITSNAVPSFSIRGNRISTNIGSELELLESGNLGILNYAWHTSPFSTGKFERPAVANSEEEVKTSSIIQSEIEAAIKSVQNIVSIDIK